MVFATGGRGGFSVVTFGEMFAYVISGMKNGLSGMTPSKTCCGETTRHALFSQTEVSPLNLPPLGKVNEMFNRKYTRIQLEAQSSGKLGINVG